MITDVTIPLPPRWEDVERWLKHVRVSAEPDQCWEWTGAKHRGYGQFTLSWWKREDGEWRCQTVRAHRFAFSIFKGPIPEGLTVEHECRNRSCVNPLHLSLLSRGENARRGNQRKTCKSGRHEMTGNNVIRRPSQAPTKGECRACANERRRKR